MSWFEFRHTIGENRVVVQSDRWYEARQFAETHFGCGHDAISWIEIFDPIWALYNGIPVYKLTWSGNAAGKRDTLKVTAEKIELVTKRPKS